MNLFARFKSSAQKLKSTKYLALMATTIAMKVILSLLPFARIPISQNLRISFGYLIVAVEAAILGPVAGMLSAAITDNVEFMLAPDGIYFPGYTLSAMLGSLVYALFLYERKVSVPRLIGAKVIVNLFVNVLLGSLWTSMMYSKGYIYYFMRSITKNVLMLPIEITLLTIVFRLLLPYLQKKNLVIDQDSLK
ncbi:MAG: folate family ECF transporter S component [Solobacterium sp.]|nr:folate family ECF transporter S component [Solobacterium sp.]